jgi:hypothetical protein
VERHGAVARRRLGCNPGAYRLAVGRDGDTYRDDKPRTSDSVRFYSSLLSLSTARCMSSAVGLV